MQVSLCSLPSYAPLYCQTIRRIHMQTIKRMHLHAGLRKHEWRGPSGEDNEGGGAGALAHPATMCVLVCGRECACCACVVKGGRSRAHTPQSVCVLCWCVVKIVRPLLVWFKVGRSQVCVHHNMRACFVGVWCRACVLCLCGFK